MIFSEKQIVEFCTSCKVHKKEDIQFMHTTCFWNNLYQVCPHSKDGKAK